MAWRPDASVVQNDLTDLTERVFTRYENAVTSLFPRSFVSEASDLATRIAIPHQFVHSEVGGSEGPPRNRAPTETVEEGGNCVDKSTLLASLWATTSVSSELVCVNDRDRDAGHLTAVATVPASGGPTRAELQAGFAQMYQRLGYARNPGDVHLWTDDGEHRIVADPEFCEYAGDIESMVEQEYVSLADRVPNWEKRDVTHDIIVPADGDAFKRHERW